MHDCSFSSFCFFSISFLLIFRTGTEVTDKRAHSLLLEIMWIRTYSIAYLSKDQSLTARTTVEKKEIERTTVQRKRVSERKGERDRQRSRIETRLSQRELYRVSIKKRNQHNCYKITVTYLTLVIKDRCFSNIHHRIGPCDRLVM